MNKMMKKNILLWSVVAMVLWCACSDKEDRLEPSYADRDWMEIRDEPGELNQLRYKLYKEYEIPTFVNDTIGSEQRGYDAYGQPIIYHEMLWPGYTLTGRVSGLCHLSSDTVGMVKMLQMMYDWVAPNLLKDIKSRPASYLLCDIVDSKEKGLYSNDTVYTKYDIQVGLKTTALSICNVKEMGQDELKDFAARIVGYATYVDLISYYEEELNEFYEISKEGLEKTPYNQKIKYSPPVPEYPDGWKEEKLYLTGGFLYDDFRSYKWDVGSSAESRTVSSSTPAQAIDVRDYVGAVMVYSESEFEQLYGKYDKMMRKFRFMKEKVAFYKTEVLKE